jgi:hypothetical protein
MKMLLVLIFMSSCGASVLASQTATATEQTSTAATSAPDQSKKQVIVTAHREKLRVLTHDLAKAEDAFFNAYNRVNTIREFDVHCDVVTPTGSLFSHRECTPRFAQDAKADEAKTTLEAFAAGAGNRNGNIPIPHGMMADEVINGKYGDYKKHLLEVVTKDPELRKMLQEYTVLKQKYDGTSKEETAVK